MATSNEGAADVDSDMPPPYAPKVVAGAWMAALWVGAAYGIFLTFTALRSMPGADLTGQFALQPLFKSLMAVLLVVAAAAHPVVRERRWLMLALVFSALGDFLLAIPWWGPSFVGGLGAFLVAHLFFLAALVPLARPTQGRYAAAGAVCILFFVMLVVFWPGMSRAGMTVPVAIYIAVLGAMVCAAVLAKLPTRFTLAGALCFAVSDGLIGTGRFVLESEALAVPIWWTYAAALALITAGLFFGRSPKDLGTSERSARPQG